MIEIDVNSAVELPDQIFQRENTCGLCRIGDTVEPEEVAHYSNAARQHGIAILAAQIIRQFTGAQHPVLDPVDKATQPWRAQIGAVIH